jgi:hypothetical protein
VLNLLKSNMYSQCIKLLSPVKTILANFFIIIGNFVYPVLIFLAKELKTIIMLQKIDQNASLYIWCKNINTYNIPSRGQCYFYNFLRLSSILGEQNWRFLENQWYDSYLVNTSSIFSKPRQFFCQFLAKLF